MDEIIPECEMMMCKESADHSYCDRHLEDMLEDAREEGREEIRKTIPDPVDP